MDAGKIIIGILIMVAIGLTITVILYATGVIKGKQTTQKVICPDGYILSGETGNVCVPNFTTKDNCDEACIINRCKTSDGEWNATIRTCTLPEEKLFTPPPTDGTSPVTPPSGGTTKPTTPSTTSGTSVTPSSSGTTNPSTPSTGVTPSSGGETTKPTTPATNLTPCKIKGVLIKEPWYQAPDDPLTCLAPKDKVSKCCYLPNGDDPTCVANFSDKYYSTQQSVIDWAKKDCNVGYSIDKLEGCPDMYTGRDDKGRCTATWSETCDEKCMETKCSNVGGNWIPLDYSTNPYTCSMPRVCPAPFTGQTIGGKCKAGVGIAVNNTYKAGCENAGGQYSTEPIPGNPFFTNASCAF